MTYKKENGNASICLADNKEQIHFICLVLFACHALKYLLNIRFHVESLSLSGIMLL